MKRPLFIFIIILSASLFAATPRHIIEVTPDHVILTPTIHTLSSDSDTIYYDDGIAYWYAPMGPLYWAVRFTPTPGSGSTFVLTAGLTMSYDTPGPCTLVVWDDMNGLPGNRIYSAVFTGGNYPNWDQVDIPTYHDADDFWLGFWCAGGDVGSQNALADSMYDNFGRSFYSVDGLSWEEVDFGDLMIRAVGHYDIPPVVGWYFKKPYPNYAPSGMPDFDQKQDNWLNPDSGGWSFCGPVAVANCFWWYDALLETRWGPGGGFPGDGCDFSSLVMDYTGAVCPLRGPSWDDHNEINVNNCVTPWPPDTGPPQNPPFTPGQQPQPSPIRWWGELIERLAWYMDCDGIRTGEPHCGTYVYDMQQAIDWWLEEAGIDSLYEITVERPDFYYIEEEIERSEDVILLLGFWVWDAEHNEWLRIGGHYVTCAGVNSESLLIAFSDPFYNAAEMGLPGRVLPGPHPPQHHPNLHNDAAYVSHDFYHVAPESPSPGGMWWIPDYPPVEFKLDNFYAMNVPRELRRYQAPRDILEKLEPQQIHTEIEYAVIISPIWTDVEERGQRPTKYYLACGYPNPFTNEVELRYEIPKPGHVSLKVYNVMGQLIKTLVDGDQISGSYSVRWDGTDDMSRNVPPGIYFYKLKVDKFIRTGKLVLMR